jgi:hypothetical protein
MSRISIYRSYRCISWTGSYRLYFLNGCLGHTDVFLGRGHTDVFLGRVLGRPSAASPCNTLVFLGWPVGWPVGVIQMYLLNGCLGHTNCISWSGHTDVFVGRGGRLTYISRNE